MTEKVRLGKVLTSSQNHTTLFAYSSSVKEGRKLYIYLFQWCMQRAWKALQFLLTALLFTVAVFQTTKFSLTVLEVSMDNQHVQDGSSPSTRLRTGMMQEIVWQLYQSDVSSWTLSKTKGGNKKDFSFPLALLQWYLLLQHGFSSHSWDILGEARPKFLI